MKKRFLLSIALLALSLVSCNKSNVCDESLSIEEAPIYTTIKEEKKGYAKKEYSFPTKEFDYSYNKTITIDGDKFTCNIAEGYYTRGSYEFVCGSKEYFKAVNPIFGLGDYNSAEFYMNFDVDYLSEISFNVRSAKMNSWYIYFSADEGATYECIADGASSDKTLSAKLDTPTKGRFALVAIANEPAYVSIYDFSITYGNTKEKPKIASVTPSLYLDVKYITSDSVITEASANAIAEVTLDHPYFDGKYYVLTTKKSFDNAIKAYYSTKYDINEFSSLIEGSYQELELKDNKLSCNLGSLKEDTTIVFVVQMNNILYFTSETRNNLNNMIDYYLENNLIKNEDYVNALKYLKK